MHFKQLIKQEKQLHLDESHSHAKPEVKKSVHYPLNTHQSHIKSIMRVHFSVHSNHAMFRVDKNLKP